MGNLIAVFYFSLLSLSNPSEQGPYSTTSAEYKLPASVDPRILDDRPTEIWGQLYWPENAKESFLPLIVFLHGNHGTCGRWNSNNTYRLDLSCEYTTTGQCPAGSVVVPSHRGFDYLAERLSSWGYVVASVNANRGINCGSSSVTDENLSKARGRLILKHLQILSEWNAGVRELPEALHLFKENQIDFSQVGLLGHSRGGDGVRVAYNFYRHLEPSWQKSILSRVTFRGIFEIGGMDFGTYNAEDVAWAQILPACDGDNSLLLGVRPFDRMMNRHKERDRTMKSLLYVWGANHNYFNSEWHESDSYGCVGHQRLFEIDRPSREGSATQREIALYSVLGFFRAHVGVQAESKFSEIFDPLYSIPDALSQVTTIERTYLSTSDRRVNPVLENFEGPEGYNFSGRRNLSSRVLVRHSRVPDYYSELQAGIIQWEQPGEDVYFQTNWGKKGVVIELPKSGSLSLRISRKYLSFPSSQAADFGMRLVDAEGNLSSEVRIGEFTSLTEPVGTFGYVHPVLNSILIPIHRFQNISFDNIRGLRFIFNGTSYGTIHLDEIRVTEGSSATTSSATILKSSTGLSIPPPLERKAQIFIKKFEIEIQSEDPFYVGASPLTLLIDGREYKNLDFPDSSNLRKLRLKLSSSELLSIRAAKSIRVQAGPARIWRVK